MTLRQPDHRIDDLLAGWAIEAEPRGLRRLEAAYWDEARPWLEERSRQARCATASGRLTAARSRRPDRSLNAGGTMSY